MPSTLVNISVLFLIACFVSLILELDLFVKNLEKGIKKSNLLYISHALVSTVCGVLLGLTGMLFEPDNYILWILMGSIGSFMGKNSLKLILGLLNTNINIFKNALGSNGGLNNEEIENLLENNDENKEE